MKRNLISIGYNQSDVLIMNICSLVKFFDNYGNLRYSLTIFMARIQRYWWAININLKLGWVITWT